MEEKERDPFTHRLPIDLDSERARWRRQIEEMNALCKSPTKKKLLVKSSSQGTLLLIKRKPLRNVRSVHNLHSAMPLEPRPWLMAVKDSES